MNTLLAEYLSIKWEFLTSIRRRMRDENYFASPSPLFSAPLMFPPAFLNLPF
jgi:hypothetical protein